MVKYASSDRYISTRRSYPVEHHARILNSLVVLLFGTLVTKIGGYKPLDRRIILPCQVQQLNPPQRIGPFYPVEVAVADPVGCESCGNSLDVPIPDVGPVSGFSGVC